MGRQSQKSSNGEEEDHLQGGTVPEIYTPSG
jgi:hypothetical protein